MVTTHSTIIDSGIRFFAGLTTDDESIAALLSLSITSLSSQEYTFDCKVTYNVAHSRRRQLRARRERSCDLLFRVELPSRIDGDRRSSNSWKVMDLGRRLHAQVSRENRGAEVNGQSTAEMTRQWTFNAERSSNGSWRSRPALELIRAERSSNACSVDLCKSLPGHDGEGHISTKVTPPIWGKDRERGYMMWLPHHSRLGKGVERGYMMCLPHLLRILAVFLSRLSWDLGLLGLTRKPWGRVQLSISLVLVGISMMHAPTPVMRVKNKRARDITHLTTVHRLID